MTTLIIHRLVWRLLGCLFTGAFLLGTIGLTKANAASQPLDSSAIKFITGATWSETLALAKRKHKHVFLDCYTTWCAPCKIMESKVFSQKDIGDFYSSDFICFRIQMDRRPMDDEVVKRAYPDAKAIAEKYHIQAYPTMLYFDENGRLMKTAVGAMEASDFLRLGKEVTELSERYSSITERWKKGASDSLDMLYLANNSESMGDTVLAESAAKKYIQLIDISGNWTPSSISLLKKYTKRSKDLGFKVFFEKENEIDEIMNDRSYSEGCVTGIIENEIAQPIIEKATKLKLAPDWTAIHSAIRNQYNQRYADRVTNIEHANWASDHEHWDEWTKYFILTQDADWDRLLSGHANAFKWNNAAWAVMTYSKDTSAWRHVLPWSERAVLADPVAYWIDTYAILQYWLGNKALAIQWETIVTKLAPTATEFIDNLEKMKKNQPVGPGK